ncbi:hypothetical protein K1719_019741 [Acacia pycnantha]|nr:hypothetical protein K1719_019741 [Acacia pycnantha]
MEASRPFFTWKGPKWDGLDRVFKRLDRCLSNVSWLEMYDNAEVRVIPRVGSDHHPLWVNLCKAPNKPEIRNFIYEVAWKMHGNFKEFLQHSWKNGEELNVMLSTLQQDLNCWNKEVFGRIEYRK